MAGDGGQSAAGVALSGSERKPLPGARRVGDVDPQTKIELTIVVRRKAGGQAEIDPSLPRAEALQQLADTAGADPQDLADVERFVRDHGMEVVSADAAQRVIVVRTTAEQAK